MRKTALFAMTILGVACAPARAGSAADAKPVAIATAEPVVTAAPVATVVPVATAIPVATPVAMKAKEPIHREKAKMRWIEGPPAIKGSRMTVLEGNPKEAGSIYTLRISIPQPVKIEAHVHPQDERVTVLEGSVLVGFGDVADFSKTTRRKAGDFYVNPAGVNHFVQFDEPTLIQMTGVGPWEMTLASP